MQTDSFISALLAYSPLEEIENKYRLDIILHVQKFPTTWWQRNTLEGHVTASAWVLNHEKTHVLFLHHRKLNKWLQPGGHLDDTDFSPVDGALREAFEETGITNLTLKNTDQPTIFDVDIHHIPARGAEPAHFHYDVRYQLALPDKIKTAHQHAMNAINTHNVAIDVAISDESLGFRWFSLDEVVREHEPSLARMAKKSLLSLNMNNR